MYTPTGINFICNLLNISGLQVFYAFTGSTDLPHKNTVDSSSVGKIAHSGTIGEPSIFSNFFNKSGSGYWDGGRAVTINNTSGIHSNTWTMVFSYELSGRQNSTLFSNYSSGTANNPINSGWLIGISDLCNPYLEYYTDQGPKILLSQNNFGTKNAFFITKNNNSVTIDLLDYNKKILESESFFVEDEFFPQSNKWLLGGYTGTPSYFSGQNFRGYMDCYMYFSPALLPSEINSISSGLYCSPTISQPAITTGIFSGITGFITGQSVLFSGITGYNSYLSGYITGNCNDVTPIYASGGLTGVIYSQNIIPLYQISVILTTGTTGFLFIENSGYTKSFNLDSISFLKDIDYRDLSELYYVNSVNNFNLNNNAVFDRTKTMFVLPQQYNLNQFNFYLNPIAQFGSGYSLSGNIYGFNLTRSGTYYISGNYLSGFSYDNLDNNIYDVISGNNRIYRLISGWTGTLDTGYQYFANGVKLVTPMTGVELDFLTGVITGHIFNFPVHTGSVYTTGLSNLRTSGFGRGLTQLYLNGVRQHLNLGTDYIEISQFSLLNNESYHIDQDTQAPLYGNNNSYIEFF